jgi:hypothetical protein
MNLNTRWIVLTGIVMVLSLGLVTVVSQLASAANPVNTKLVVDTTKAKIQDLNNNKQPDAGEFVSIVGTLYATGTQNEIGKYRCFFSWGGWANTTEGVPVTPAVQVFDIKGNGTIVAVGDEPSMDAEGKRVDAAIAGGTGSYKSITGIVGLTENKMEEAKVPFDVAFDIKWP